MLMPSPAKPDETQASAAPARLLFRNILQGSSLYSLAIVGGALCSIILLPVNTRFLTKTDFGVLDLLERVTTAFTYLLGLNFSSVLGFFYFKENTQAHRTRVMGTIFTGSLVLGSFAGGLGVIFALPISRFVFASPDYVHYLQVVFLALPLSFIAEVGMSWLRVEDRTGSYVKASFFRIGLLLGGTLLGVAALRLRVWGMLAANISAIGLLAIVLAVYCFRIYRFVFDRPLFMHMVRFAIPLGLSGVALFIVHFGDRFILPHYRPLSDLGIYSIAYKIGMLIGVVHASFQNYWNAQVYQIARRPDANSVVARTFSYLMLILSFCGLGLIVAAKPTLHILTSPAFRDAALLVPVIVLAYYLRAIGDFFRCLFLVEGRPGYEAICNWIGGGACLIGYFLLIPRWGIWGAAYATLIAFLVIGIVSVVWVYRLKPFSVETSRLSKIILATTIPLAAYFLLPFSSLAAQIGWSALLILSYPVLLGLMSFPTPSEWDLLRSLPLRLRQLIGRA
jgi:O-antigen/teichoic acid export membrane protein